MQRANETHHTQKENEGFVNINVALASMRITSTSRKVLNYAIEGLQNHSGGSNYDLYCLIDRIEYRPFCQNWRVYVNRSYVLREGGDVNKYPGTQTLDVQIDSIVHSKRGLLMYANGPYRSQRGR